MNRIVTTALVGAALIGAATQARAQELRVGWIGTYTGPLGVLGRHTEDGFQLAVEEMGGRIGGLPTTILTQDDQGKPEIGIQAAQKMIQQDHIDILAGVAVAPVVMAVQAVAARAHVPMLGPVAGPSILGGKRCSPWFFAMGWDNNEPSEAMGAYLQGKGQQDVYIMAPNFEGGKDAITGFKRFYKGSIAGEAYTPLNQQDYSAELTVLKNAQPKAVFVFYPGNVATNYVNQYVQYGLMKDFPLFSASSIDPTTLPGIGAAALGTFQAGDYNEDLPNAANQQFVAHFKAKYHYTPSTYAAHAYDSARLMDAAVRDVKDPSDHVALVHALESVKFASVRGNFHWNTNHYPIEDFWLLEVVHAPDGGVMQVRRSQIFADHQDANVADCQMPAP